MKTERPALENIVKDFYKEVDHASVVFLLHRVALYAIQQEARALKAEKERDEQRVRADCEDGFREYTAKERDAAEAKLKALQDAVELVVQRPNGWDKRIELHQALAASKECNHPADSEGGE